MISLHTTLLPGPMTLRLSVLRLMLLASIVAIAVVAAAVVVYEQTTFKPRAVLTLRQQSGALAEVILPPLEFGDTTTAIQYLATRRRYPDIYAVGLYAANGQRVAEYVRDADALIHWPTDSQYDEYEFVNGKLHLWHPVLAGDRIAGFLFTCAEIPPLYARLPQYGIMASAVLLALLAVAVILLRGLQRNFLTPLEQLTAVTEQVTQHKDYALRAPVRRADELGRLAVGLNEMLATVASRDHALRNSEARMRSIVETEPECVKIISKDGVLMEMNPAGLAMLEADSLADARGQPLLQFVAEEFRDAFSAMHRRVIQGEYGALEFQSIGMKGTRRWLETRAVPLRNPDGSVESALAITRDVTERKQIESRLAQRTQQQAAVVNLGLEAFATPNLDCLFNRAVEIVATVLHAEYTAIFEIEPGREYAKIRAGTGWDASVMEQMKVPIGSGTPSEVALTSDAPILIDDAASDPRFTNLTLNTRFGIASGIGVAIRGKGLAWGTLWALSTKAYAFAPSDVSLLQEVANLLAQVIQRMLSDAARVAAEEQLLQSQKMDALGRLAGGIAHDFNNLLSAILGNAQLAREDVGPAHPSVVSLEQIQNAGRRAKELVQRILTFSRQQTPHREPVKLQPIVDDVARLLRATIPAGVVVHAEIAADIPAVLADSAQIHQTLLNLGTNAWQAIGGAGGRIELALYTCEASQALLQAHAGLRAGRYVCVSVTDSGCGMDAAVQRKIFDPFFTTKPLGEGTGLGLSVVLGIMQAHGGTVTVASELGHGAKFTLYFPAADDAIEARQIAAVPSAANLGGGERILYLDDEEPLVFLATRLLERVGYRIDGFTKPDQALATFKADPTAYSLVITDLSMPSMSGMEVAREILSLQPDAVVVLASGYLRQADIDAAKAIGIREVVLKPNTVDELVPMVQRLLANARVVASN